MARLEQASEEDFKLQENPAGLTRSRRLVDYAVMLLAVVLGGGSMVYFGWTGRPMLLDMQLSPTAALWWNALLSLVFFTQHSVMVRRSVRNRLAAIIPARYDRAFYAISSGVVLTLVAVLYQRVEEPLLFALHGLPRLIVIGAAVLAVASIVWTFHVLGTFDLFGIRSIHRHLRNCSATLSVETPVDASVFVVRGPFRWVRHPVYSAVIVLFWATPQMSPGRLEMAALWTAWICVGALLEERDLVAEFGETYRQYSKQVPMLIPWRGPVGT